MAVGEELGVGYVTLTVSTKGMGKDIAKQFRDAERQASKSGRKMGKDISDEFNKNVDLSEMQRKVQIAEAKATKAIEDAAKAQEAAKRRVREAEEKLAAEVERTAEAQRKAADKAQAAAAKVALEQRKLAVARQKAENAAREQEAAERRLQTVLDESGDESEAAAKASAALNRAREKAADTAIQAEVAENRLAKARTDATDAAQAGARAEKSQADARDKLSKKVDESKRAYEAAERAAKDVADSENHLQRELRESKRAFEEASEAAKRGGKDAEEEYRDGWKGLAKRLGHQVSRAVDKALDSVSVVGQGIAHGVAYAESFKAGMKSVHIGSPVSGVSALMGGRALGDMGRGFKDFLLNLDKSIPKMGLVAAGIGSIGAAGFSAVGGIVGVAAGLGSIAAVGLTLPGTIAGAIAGFSVLAMAMADVTEVLADLGPGFAALQDVVSANFWSIAADPIRALAYTILPILQTQLGAVATEFGVMAAAVANTLGSAQNIGFLNQQMEFLRQAVDIAGEGAVWLTDGLMKLGTVGASYLPRLVSWANEVAEAFDAWVDASMQSGKIWEWIDTGLENLKALGWVLVSTVGIFHALGEAAANAGSGGLIGLANGMRAVNEAMHGDVFQGAMTQMFVGAGLGMQYIGAGISALGDAFVDLAPTISSVMTYAGEAIGTLLEGISTALQQPIFQQGLLDFFKGIKAGAEALQPAMGPLGDLFGHVGSLAGVMATNLGHVLGSAIQYLGPVFGSLIDAVKPLIPILGDALVWAIQTVAPILQGLVDKLASFVQDNPQVAAAIALVAGAFGLIAGAVIKVMPFLLAIGKVVGDVVGHFGGLGQAAGGVGNALRLIAGPVGLIIGGIGLLVGAIIHAWNTSDQFRDAVGRLGSALGDIFQLVGQILMPVLSGLGHLVGVVLIGAFEFLKPYLIMTAELLAFLAEKIAVGLKLAIDWFTNVGIPAFQAGIALLGEVFSWLNTSVIQPVWAGIKYAISAVAGWFALVVVPGFQAALTAVGNAFTWLNTSVIQPVWSVIKTVIANAWNFIRDFILNPMIFFIQVPLAGAWNFLAGLVSQIWLQIRSVSSAAWGWLRDSVLQPVINFIRVPLSAAWNWLRDLVSQTWSNIKITVSNGWSWVRNTVLQPLINFVRGSLTAAWNWFRDLVGNVWTGIRVASSAAWNFVRDRVFDPLKRGIDLVKQGFEKAQDGISSAWNKLRDAVKAPVSFVVNRVINPFITGYNGINDFWKGPDIGTIKGFARGGVLPGLQRRKKDDVLTPMRSGEGVLVPEVVRGIGGASTINALNAAGNSGGEGAVQKLWHKGAFARGDSGHDHAYAGVPSGVPAGGLWGAIQTQMNRTGKLYVPRTRVLGADIAEAAKAWMGQSALDIIPGNGSPGVSAGVGHRGPWGFADTSGRLEISTTTPANRRMGVAIHELGHILSLTHPAGGYGATGSVMSAGMAGGDWPHAVDYQMLRSVWGKPGEGVTRYSASDVEGVTANSIDPIAWIADKLDKFITGPIKRAKDRFAGNQFAGMPIGIASSLFDGVKKKAAELAAPFLGVIDFGKKVFNGVASQVKVRTWMNEALHKKGLLNPGNMASGVARAMKESGGDPNIIQQVHDINSGGNEARGLMQVTPATFKENMEPGHGNIFDPIDNILASINYTLRRYGSVRSGWDLPGGYALGGVVDHVWDAPVGATHALRPGVSTVYNGTGSTEYFERVSLDSDSSERPAIHVDTIQALDVDDAMRKLRREIAWEEALYR